MRYVASVALAVLVVACMQGCASPGADTASPGNSQNGSAFQGMERWPYWPTSFRIHPLTRLATDPETGEPIVEARLEFVDRDGNPTRAYGQLRMNLLSSPDEMLTDETPRWEVDLRDLELNNERYDDVTRTYLFPLEIEPGLLDGQPELRAFFLSADDQPLEQAKLLLRTE